MLIYHLLEDLEQSLGNTTRGRSKIRQRAVWPTQGTFTNIPFNGLHPPPLQNGVECMYISSISGDMHFCCLAVASPEGICVMRCVWDSASLAAHVCAYSTWGLYISVRLQDPQNKK